MVVGQKTSGVVESKDVKFVSQDVGKAIIQRLNDKFIPT